MFEGIQYAHDALGTGASFDKITLSIPVSTVHPIVTTLPNGLKLIVQPESISRMGSFYSHVRNNPYL